MSNKTKLCEYCKKEFISKTKRSKYCYEEHSANCLLCNKSYIFFGASRHKTCSRECGNQLAQLSRIKTFNKKFGTDNPFQNKKIKEKIKKTMLKKYSVKNISLSLESKKKKKKTFEDKYGGTCPFDSPEIKEKIEENNMKKFGYKNPAKSEVIKKKTKQTNLQKYGYESNLSSPIIRDKIRKTNLERYGHTNYLCSDEAKKHRKQVNLENYGVPWGLVYGEHFKIQNLEDWRNLEKYIKENKNKFTVNDLCNYFNSSYYAMRQRINTLNLSEHIVNFNKLSKPEVDWFNFLINIGFDKKDIIFHDRKTIYPNEIDLYLPKYRLGLEISPTYTHKISKLKNTRYHQNKFLKCYNNSVNLITIFDWSNELIIQSILLDYLDKSDLTKYNYLTDLSYGFYRNNLVDYSEPMLHKINDDTVFDCGYTYSDRNISCGKVY